MFETVFALIDLRSFSNLWYWIALAVMWSITSHWVLGVPYDMVIRARRHGGQAQIDLQDIARINTSRLLHYARASGHLILGFVSFLFTVLGILAFYYWVEIAQAIFLLMFPMLFVGLMSLATARRIVDQNLVGEALRRCLANHRFWVQVLGMVSILVTSIFGMYQNFSLGALDA